MIQLSGDYLLFELESGERVPFSADKISVELAGDESGPFDAEFLEQATKAVFHFFRHELLRDTVTLGEFSAAMERVLRSFLRGEPRPTEALADRPVAESDLSRLLAEAEQTELLFFPRLRDELRTQLRTSPRVMRFHGLRACVKRLAGARRWSPRCRDLQERIVDFLRACAAADRAGKDCSLVVE
jgi:hypothetical protein